MLNMVDLALYFDVYSWSTTQFHNPLNVIAWMRYGVSYEGDCTGFILTLIMYIKYCNNVT